MARVIVIRNLKDVTVGVGVLNRIKRRVPEMTREEMRKWGRILEKDLRHAARQARISPGVLTEGKGIEWRQRKRSNTGYLFMKIYGIYLDSMKPHFVNVTRQRSRLLMWASIARKAPIRRKAEDVIRGKRAKFSVYVRPHPFIHTGYTRARKKLRPILKRGVSRAVHTA